MQHRRTVVGRRSRKLGGGPLLDLRQEGIGTMLLLCDMTEPTAVVHRRGAVGPLSDDVTVGRDRHVTQHVVGGKISGIELRLSTAFLDGDIAHLVFEEPERVGVEFETIGPADTGDGPHQLSGSRRLVGIDVEVGGPPPDVLLSGTSCCMVWSAYGDQPGRVNDVRHRAIVPPPSARRRRRRTARRA